VLETLGQQVDTTAEEQNAVADQETRNPLQGTRIFVVEDDPDINDVITLTLETAGVEVTQFLSVESALKALSEGQPPDLILTDCSIGENMNGPDLVNHVRNNPTLARIPIAFVAGVEERHPLHDPMVKTGCKVLPKPFETEDLISFVQEALRQQEP
jgi:CheY-like chemotaxis protein